MMSGIGVQGAEAGWHIPAHRQTLRPVGHRPITFGSFEVLPAARTLLQGGLPVEIGSRAFDVLMALLGARGEIVSKEVIMQRAWPTTMVDESNLRHQMSSLRRLLGREQKRIKTVPGRGYLFIADEFFQRTPQAAQPTPRSSANQPAIVIIESDRESREHLSGLLAAAGASVQIFASVSAFLARGEIVSSRARPLRIAERAA